ncbi:MAG: CDP-alcohol phosphatidyltransferase family protein [Candidatus Omnitrophota bacterium]
MESIKELKMICQQIRHETDDWYMWHVLRKISILVTWFLLHTPINANGVTLLFILTGFGICGLFLSGTKLAFFLGALGLHFWYVLDLVDGEIARYRKESKATGRFFDYMAHYIVHPWFFIAIGFGLYRTYGNLAIFLCSIVAGYSVHLVEAMVDVYCSVLYKRVKAKLLDPAKDIVFKKMPAFQHEQKNKSIARRVFSALHYVSTFPAILYIMLPLSILNLLLPVEVFVPWILFYACVPTLVWLGRVTVFVREKKIDSEYTQLDNALQARGR